MSTYCLSARARTLDPWRDTGVEIRGPAVVADGRWARVGSTNLNPVSWMGNWELDLIVEDEGFGQAMEEMYLEDLRNTTEIVLRGKRKIVPVGRSKSSRIRDAGGSAGRAVSGAVRIGNVIGAVITAKREHGPAETSLLGWLGIILTAMALVALIWPRLLAYPIAAVMPLIALPYGQRPTA